jgi:hypothetical protein
MEAHIARGAGEEPGRLLVLHAPAMDAYFRAAALTARDRASASLLRAGPGQQVAASVRAEVRVVK